MQVTCVTSQCHAHSQSIHRGGQGHKRWSCCCASPAQQEQEHWSVINSVSAMDAKHRTVWAVVKKIHTIPARPSTATKCGSAPLEGWKSVLLSYWKKTTPKPTNQAKYQTPKKLLFCRAKNSTLTIDIHNTKMKQTTLGELDINKLSTMNRIQSGHLWELGEKVTSSEPFWNVICCNSKRTMGGWREIWITEYRVLCQMRMYSLLRIKAKVKLVETF